jgi:hypothetical protein
MEKFWKSKEFEALQREWDLKLLEDGFEDAERRVNGDVLLWKPADRACQDVNAAHVVREGRLEYFTLISQAASEETGYEDYSDQLIMERTGEGRNSREISEELATLGMWKSNRNTIRHVRRRYENKWGIRSWKPEQMTPKKPPIK